jgi:ABC-type proline/glycine betaine transport system ATPase subunit
LKKIIWENIATIHSILKNKNYKVKFLINSILKKIKLTKIILEKKQPKKGGEIMLETL